MGIKFGNWPEEMHTDVDQVKRIQSGMKLSKKKILEMDLSEGSDAPVIVIQGSAHEPYVSTLTSCTCADFEMRMRPCKHIYFLADQMGLLSGLPEYKKRGALFKPKQELERYRGLYETGEMSIDSYIKIGSALKKMIK